MNRQTIIERLYKIEQAHYGDPLFHKLDRREIDEMILAVEELAMPRPIDTAPEGDGWILGEVGASDFRRAQPWAICTRGDGGWFDEEDEPVAPTRWLALPDPQPKPTGWRKAEGEVVVECGWLGEERERVWLVSVVKPNGEYDDDREPIISYDPMVAVDQGNDWACELGLPKREGNMDHAAAAIVPIGGGPEKHP